MSLLFSVAVWLSLTALYLDLRPPFMFLSPVRRHVAPRSVSCLPSREGANIYLIPGFRIRCCRISLSSSSPPLTLMSIFVSMRMEPRVPYSYARLSRLHSALLDVMYVGHAGMLSLSCTCTVCQYSNTRCFRMDPGVPSPRMAGAVPGAVRHRQVD